MAHVDVFRMTRDEYLGYLRSLMDSQDIRDIAPGSRNELNQILDQVMGVKFPDGNIPDGLREYVLDSLDADRIEDAGLLSYDSYLKKESALLYHVIPDEAAEFLKANVTFGSVLEQDLNGLCVRVPSGGYSVLLHFGTLNYLELIANLLASCMEFNTPSGILRPKISHSQAAGVVHRISEKFPHFAPSEVGYDDFRVSLSGSEKWRAEFSCRLGDQMVNFILAHEFGHVLAGHLNNAQAKSVVVGEGTADVMSLNWTQELEADKIGASILLKYAQKENALLQLATYLGIHAFFMFLEVVEGVDSIGSETHPPAIQRRKQMRESMNLDESTEGILRVLEQEVFGV